MIRNRNRRIAMILMAILLATPLAAVSLPRGTLWSVEQTCMLNAATTGSPFPCLAVDRTAGFVVLRAPFRETHIVVMPTARVSGIEDPRLRGPLGTGIIAQAWAARRFVQTEARRPLGWNDLGLAVNSAFTRSQDQLHVHVDCVAAGVKRDLAARLAGMPTGAWLPNGFAFRGESYWTRRLVEPELGRVNLPRLLDEIPALHAEPWRATLAVVGAVDAAGAKGFVLLAGSSDLAKGDLLSTSEDMLDHHCRRRAS